MSTFFLTMWQTIGNFFVNSWGTFLGMVRNFELWDALDILVVALFCYFIVRLVRNSRAEQLFRGILFLAALYIIAAVLKLTAVLFLFKILFDNALVILIVVFQPEVRRALEQAGHSKNGVMRLFNGLRAEDSTSNMNQWNKSFHATALALENLQKMKMGALVVFERGTHLGEVIRTGTIIEAEPSAALISAVFFNKAPLHDGAMVIRDGKVYASACILPLSENLQISRDLGTRHRAGVGMSEQSDAIVVILSEETGIISVADGGVLTRNYTPEQLEKTLADKILWNQEQPEIVKKLRKHRKSKAKEEKE